MLQWNNISIYKDLKEMFKFNYLKELATKKHLHLYHKFDIFDQGHRNKVTVLYHSKQSIHLRKSMSNCK